MGKHVCPVCETVYATKGALEIKMELLSLMYECWQCPACGYKFVSLFDLEEIISKLNLQKIPKIAFHDTVTLIK
jgi:C4-type Zn-finger protein